ncbi:hypothetical protein [Vulgatibacter incomptus]|uniref:Putative protease n=1 Tax=Vulgatibacter incomptus TaxID=1391653 RepID=A0A0K1PCQ4_9BACT|nr:hypothetical protein [Vulgatibacter incomptus]AKU90899.1 putative protease [Vulgatibacter incomptus]
MIDPEDLSFEPEREGTRPRATELLRKAVLSGVGALFMTEEGLRSMLKDLKLPKDVLNGALVQADKTKGELLRLVGAELRSFLQSSKVRDDVLAMLSQLTLEVRAEVAIKPRGETASAFEPDVKGKVTVKRRSPAGKRATKKARPR